MATLPAIVELAESMEVLAALVEAAYTYDTENVKRWVLGDGGRSGNCETCNENADMDWVPDDDTFLSVSGSDIDGPPAHPNCTCELEYKERRFRVYD